MYVIVFDIVVYYFDVVISIFVINLFIVSFIIVFGSNVLEDVFDEGLGWFIIIGYDGGVVVGIFFIIGDIGIDEVEIFGGKVFCFLVGVGEMWVIVIDDDVISFEKGKEGFDLVIDSFVGLDEKYDVVGVFEFFNEFFGRVSVDNVFVFGFVGKEVVDFGNGMVESVNGEVMVGYV